MWDDLNERVLDRRVVARSVLSCSSACANVQTCKPQTGFGAAVVALLLFSKLKWRVT